MHQRINSLILLLLFALPYLPGKADAKTIPLSVHHQSPKEYDKAIESIEPGDTLEFENGTKKTVGKRLGAGSTTAIYELSGNDGAVLRVPLHLGMFQPGNLSDPIPYIEFINGFIDGDRILEKASIPKVKIVEALRDQYVVVERIKFGGATPITLGEFLYRASYYPEEVFKRMCDEYLLFIRQTSVFASVGDFHKDQVVYDEVKHEWRLLDWYNNTTWKDRESLGSFFYRPRYDPATISSNYIERVLKGSNLLDGKTRARLENFRYDIDEVDALSYRKWGKLAAKEKQMRGLAPVPHESLGDPTSSCYRLSLREALSPVSKYWTLK